MMSLKYGGVVIIFYLSTDCTHLPFQFNNFIT